MITDHNINWIRGRRFYTLGDLLTGLTSPALTAGAGSEALAKGQMLENAATAAATGSQEVILGLLSTFGISALQMTGSITTKLHFLLELPNDLDPKFPLGFTINWSGTAAASGGRGVTWKPNLNFVKKGAAFLTAASVVTPLDTLIVNSLNSGANFNEVSSRGILNNCKLTRQDIEAGAVLQMVLDAQANSSPGTINLLGIEMDYAIQAMVGSGSFLDQPTLTAGNA